MGMNTSEPSPLRSRPNSVVTVNGRADGKVLNSTPEILGCIVLVPGCHRIYTTSNGDVVGRAPEAMDSGVETDLQVEGVTSWFEEEGVTVGAKLIGFLSFEDAVNLGLDRRTRHTWVKDEDIGSKVDRARRWQCCVVVGDWGGNRDGRRGVRIRMMLRCLHGSFCSMDCCGHRIGGHDSMGLSCNADGDAFQMVVAARFSAMK